MAQDNPGQFALARKILFASSDASLLVRAERILAALEYQVLPFADGIDALTGVVNHRPGLIFIDASLNRLTAHQLCYLVKRNVEFRPIPVIILSSTNGLNERAKSHSVGAIYQLVKPFDDQELLRAARYCMAICQ